MELELGLKLTRAADEFISDFHIAKDRGGPLFVSQETEAMFILTAHLKGYKRGNIKIDINEEGSLIAISGERQVKETLMVGWKVYKKDTEIKGFKKVFRIPDGVILDKIKATFSKESTLTITMPKKVKVVRGTAIEEIKEKLELDRKSSGSLQIADEMDQRGEAAADQEKDEKARDKDRLDEMPREDEQVEKPVSGDSHAAEDPRKDHELERREKGQKDEGLEKHEELIQGSKGSADLESSALTEKEVSLEEAQVPKEETETQETGRDREPLGSYQLAEHDQHLDKTDYIQETGEPSAVEPPEEGHVAEPGKAAEGGARGRRCNICIPIVAGSTLLLSFAVFVIQMIRSKNQTGRRRD